MITLGAAALSLNRSLSQAIATVLLVLFRREFDSRPLQRKSETRVIYNRQP